MSESKYIYSNKAVMIYHIAENSGGENFGEYGDLL